LYLLEVLGVITFRVKSAFAYSLIDRIYLLALIMILKRILIIIRIFQMVFMLIFLISLNFI